MLQKISLQMMAEEVYYIIAIKCSKFSLEDKTKILVYDSDNTIHIWCSKHERRIIYRGVLTSEYYVRFFYYVFTPKLHHKTIKYERNMNMKYERDIKDEWILDIIGIH